MNYAVLFLDDLEIQRCESLAALVRTTETLACGSRPFATLRYTERGPRTVWHVRNVHYQDPKYKA